VVCLVKTHASYQRGWLTDYHPLRPNAKVKLYLSLIKHHSMKRWWSGGTAPGILNLGTRWRCVVSFTARPLYPGGKSPCYPLHRGCVGPRVGLDAVEKRMLSRHCPCQELHLVHPVRSLVSIPTEVPQLQQSGKGRVLVNYGEMM
jgi:hypothetical protein